ncbi:MAG: hypothetical protein WC812_03305 [Candidatus Pacearchaeota archaeon]|jgi:hypothetical protein
MVKLEIKISEKSFGERMKSYLNNKSICDKKGHIPKKEITAHNSVGRTTEYFTCERCGIPYHFDKSPYGLNKH